jgi:hypothetical protein
VTGHLIFSPIKDLPLRLDHVKDTIKESLRVEDFQTCFSREILRLPVPVTAKRLCKLIGVPILKPSEPLPIAATVLQQKDSAIRSTNPSHLFKRRDRIWERARGKRRNYGVKALIGERKSLSVRQQKGDVHPQFCRAFYGAVQHCSAPVCGCDLTAKGVVPQVLSRSYRNFQDFARCVRDEPLPEYSDSK